MIEPVRGQNARTAYMFLYRCLAASALSATVVLAIDVGRVEAADPADHFIHWAYSAYFGTGWYQVSDIQEVFVARLAPRWDWGTPGFDDWKGRQIATQLRLPLTLGLHDIDASDIVGALDVNNFATASLTPGVEVAVPMSAHWTLQPYAYAGWGTEFGADEQAWIYWAGIKSQYEFAGDERRWTLLNSVGYLGYLTGDDISSDAVPIMAGVALQSPAPFASFAGQSTVLHWHATYTAYLDKLDFNIGRLPDVKIAGEWEIGAAIGRATGKIRFGQFAVDRIGVAYRFSDTGDFEGINLIFRSVFDR